MNLVYRSDNLRLGGRLNGLRLCLRPILTTEHTSQIVMIGIILIDLLIIWLHLLSIYFHPRRRYGTKCSGCNQGIAPSDLVRKQRDKVFHLNCFTCYMCRKQLSTGEQLYVVDENKFMCKDDYLLGKQSLHSSLAGKLRFTILFETVCRSKDSSKSSHKSWMEWFTTIKYSV